MGSPNSSFWDDVSSAVTNPVESVRRQIAEELEQALKASGTARRNLEFLVFGMMKGVAVSNLKLDAATSKKLAYLASSTAMSATMPALLLPRIGPFAEGFVEGLGSGATSFVDLAKLVASGQLMQMFKQSLALLTTPAAQEFEAKGYEMGRGAANSLAAALSRSDWEAAVVRAVGKYWGEEVFENILTGGFAKLFRVAKTKAVGIAERGLSSKPKQLVDARGLETPVIGTADPAFVHPTPTKKNRNKKSYEETTAELDFEDVDAGFRKPVTSQEPEFYSVNPDGSVTPHHGTEYAGGSSPDAPTRTSNQYKLFIKLFSSFMERYEKAMYRVWNKARDDVFANPKYHRAHKRWIDSFHEMEALMEKYPIDDHAELAEKLTDLEYSRIVREANRIVADGVNDGDTLYRATRTKAVQSLPIDTIHFLRGVINKISALPKGQKVIHWSIADMKAGKAPNIRGTQNGVEQLRPINRDHIDRLSENPWKAVDRDNLRDTFAKDNQVNLERARNKGGFVTEDPIVQWLRSVRSKGSGVSPQRHNPKEYDVRDKGTPRDREEVSREIESWEARREAARRSR